MTKDTQSRPKEDERDPATRGASAASNRAERTAERRAAIVEAAFDEFVARGFTATRIDDIAKRAGVAKGTIYLHFKDKEALFLAAVDEDGVTDADERAAALSTDA